MLKSKTMHDFSLSRDVIKRLPCFVESSSFRNSGTSTTLREVRDGSTTEAAFRRLSDAERVLLENLDIGRCRTRHTGRFLTMHKRRRKRLITRSLNQEPGILDDIFHGLVQVMPMHPESKRNFPQKHIHLYKIQIRLNYINKLILPSFSILI